MKYSFFRALGILLLFALLLPGAPLTAQEPSPEEMEQRLRTALEADPESIPSVRALLWLARRSSDRGEHEAALNVLENARRLAPHAEDVLSAQARAYLAAGAPAPAVGVLEALRSMHPQEHDYLYLLGIARTQIGDLDNAVLALRASLEVEPRRAVVWLGLGLALNHQKLYTEAQEALERCLRLAPGNLDALAALAQAQEGLDRLDLAEATALGVLARNSDDHNALLVLGMVQRKQERYTEAVETLRKAVEIQPDSSKAHYQLSLVLARTGDREGSREHLELYRNTSTSEEERLLRYRGVDPAQAEQ